jgi:ribosome-associated translation inhibitor RaiA
MALPKNIRPEYSTTIPSTGKRIKYQPFSVKEEKVLVLAAEGNDSDEITNAITNVLQACVTSPADFKVEELALFDIEYLFLKTRAKSAGEKIKVNLTDPNDTTFSVEHEINIDKISVVKDKEHTDLIELSDTIAVKMKYPDISFFNEGVNLDGITETTSMVARCIKQIVIGEEVYNSTDMSSEEVVEWLEGLTTEQFTKISKFFATMPKLSHSVTVKNTKTDTDFTVKLEGLADFF